MAQPPTPVATGADLTLPTAADLTHDRGTRPRASTTRALDGTQRPPLLHRYALVLLVLYAVPALALALKPTLGVYDEFDEVNFHYPVVRDFAATFPHVDLVHYNSATGPFYHLMMASVLQAFPLTLTQLRVVNAALSGLVLLVAFHFIARMQTPVKALLFGVILALSPYFLGPAVRLSTDNVALGFAIAALACLTEDPPTPSRLWRASTLSALAIATRQIHAWLIPLTALRGFFGAESVRARAERVLPVVLPSLLLLTFVVLWKGFAPPKFAESHTAALLNPRAALYTLAILGMYGSFFSPWLLEGWRRGASDRRVAALAVTVVVVTMLAFPMADLARGPSSEFGGTVRRVAERFPDLLGSSLAYWAFVPLGVVYVYVMSRDARNRWLLIGAVLWMIVMTKSEVVFEKYYCSMTFILLGCCLPRRTSEPAYYWTGPALLVAIMSTLVWLRFFAA